LAFDQLDKIRKKRSKSESNNWDVKIRKRNSNGSNVTTIIMYSSSKGIRLTTNLTNVNLQVEELNYNPKIFQELPIYSLKTKSG
jgi:hypothetical protein